LVPAVSWKPSAHRLGGGALKLEAAHLRQSTDFRFFHELHASASIAKAGKSAATRSIVRTIDASRTQRLVRPATCTFFAQIYERNEPTNGVS